MFLDVCGFEKLHMKKVIMKVVSKQKPGLNCKVGEVDTSV